MTKKDFPKKYGPTAFQDHVEKAKKAFDDEDYVESFVFLYTVLESYLLITWASFTFLFSAKKIWNVNDVHPWKYFECVELLSEVNLLTSNEKSIFLNFKKGRDYIVHELTQNARSNVWKTSKKYKDEDISILVKKDALIVRNIGTPPINPDKIFDLGYSERVGGSAGFGLYISKRILAEVGYKLFYTCTNSTISFVIRKIR